MCYKSDHWDSSGNTITFGFNYLQVHNFMYVLKRNLSSFDQVEELRFPYYIYYHYPSFNFFFPIFYSGSLLHTFINNTPISALGFLWREWCWSWNSSTLATSHEELTHWKILWCWEGLGAGGEGDNRGWDDWMASSTQWTWVWVNSGCCRMEM